MRGERPRDLEMGENSGQGGLDRRRDTVAFDYHRIYVNYPRGTVSCHHIRAVR